MLTRRSRSRSRGPRRGPGRPGRPRASPRTGRRPAPGSRAGARAPRRSPLALAAERGRPRRPGSRVGLATKSLRPSMHRRRVLDPARRWRRPLVAARRPYAVEVPSSSARNARRPRRRPRARRGRRPPRCGLERPRRRRASAARRGSGATARGRPRRSCSGSPRAAGRRRAAGVAEEVAVELVELADGEVRREDDHEVELPQAREAFPALSARSTRPRSRGRRRGRTPPPVEVVADLGQPLVLPEVVEAARSSRRSSPRPADCARRSPRACRDRHERRVG